MRSLAIALRVALPLFAEDAVKPTLTLSGLAQIHARSFTAQSGPVAETPDTFLHVRCTERARRTPSRRSRRSPAPDLRETSSLRGAVQLNAAGAHGGNRIAAITAAAPTSEKNIVIAWHRAAERRGEKSEVKSLSTRDRQ